MDKYLAIIPARGGSKRIPRKNIKLFSGQPIIKYSIDVAISSGLFDEVMVSTDDKEIAELSVKLGAKVPFMRSKKNADDFAGTANVIEEVLIEYTKRGCNFSYVCCIYPTAPFITVKKIKEGLKLLKKSGADLVMPVARFSYPIQRAFKIEDGKLFRMWPEYEKTRSQDLEAAYHDVGQFYWHRVESFLRKRENENYKIIPMVINELEMHDIDNEEDWKIAELKIMYKKDNY